MLDLSTISFKVDTSELDRAGKAIGELVTNVGKLDKAARDAAQTEATLARAAKDNAKANLDNAKAQDVRLKSTITADKADQANEKAIVKKTKALEDQNNSLSSAEKLLVKTRDAVNYLTAGLSRGQATQTAHLKSLGATNDQIDEFIKLKQLERKLIGKDTLDDSQQGLLKLKNAYSELRESIRQYNAESGLTSKQTRELARDKERIIESNKAQGASFQDIRKAVRARNDEYIKLAEKYNKAISAEDAVIKSRKEAVNATNYLTQADQKMAAALNTSNAALDKAGTDSLVKYETALRKSGISQDVATAKLAKYKAQLEQVQIQEQKRREQHLAKALAPQATDVVVSLWSGQNPLTVLLQQGGQVTDLFMQSGVAAEKFGEVVKSSMKSMLPSILNVVKGVGGLLVDGLKAAGNATQGFIADIFGVTGAMDKFYMKLSENGPSKFGGMILTASSIITGVFAAGIAVVVAALVAFGIGLKQVIEENNELAKSFALSGASMGVSHTQVINYVRELSKSGATTGQATEALVAMAKAGKFTSEEILLVGNAAVQMQKNFGVSIEDTVKQFAKLKEKPVEALLEIAKSSGMVAPEVLKMVIELEKAGKVSDAAALAMKSYGDVTKQQISQMRENYNGFALFMIDLGQKIKKFFSDTFKTLFLATDPTKQLEGQLANTQKLINQYKSAASYSPDNALGLRVKGLEEQARMISSQISATTRLADEESRRKQINAENAAYEEATLKLRQGAEDAIEKELRKTKTLADFRRNFVEDKLKDAAREKAVDLEKLKQNKDLVSLLEKQADIEYKKMPKSDSSKSENYFATIMREATAASIKADDATKSLTASQVELIETVKDPRFLELSKGKQEIYLSTMAANAGKEQQIALTNAQADAEERLLKLLGKSSGIGRQYYTDMANMEKDAALLGKSREEIEELTRAIFMATPAWKAYEKALEDVKNAARKFNEDSIASQAATLKENESLDYRLSLLGKTAEEQRALSIEYNRANKISEVRIKLAKQLRDIEADIEKAKKDGLPEEKYKNLIDAQVQARKDAAEQEKVINREVAVQYREDFQREFIDPIRNGLTDSIVTALFEGGKAGSKKLRDVLVNTLRQRVTIVVDAVVNTLVGSVIGSTVGGAGGANTVQTGFSALNGSISSTIGNAFSKFAGSSVGQSLGLSNAQAIAGNNPSAYVPPGGELTARGQAMGNAMGVIGDTLAGYALGSMTRSLISGGYSVGKGMDNFQKAGIAVGSALGGPVAGAIIGAGAGLVNRAFGRKLKDSGIQGTFGGQSGFEGESFEFYKGGWFRSDKTKTSPLDEEVRKTLGDAFNAMRVEVGTFATLLGLETDRLAGFTTSIKISTKGLDEEAAQEKIQEALATANNELAEQVIGSWQQTVETISRTIITGDNTEAGNGLVETQFDEVITKTSYTASEYAKEGEKAIDTLRRLATSLGTVNAIWDNLGYTVYEASLRGADAASKIGEAFGGLEAMAAQFDTYIDQYYTEDEKRTNLARSSANALQSVGLAVSAEDILGASRPIVRGFVEAVLAEFGPSSPQYVAAVQQANVIAGLYTDVTDAVSGLSEVMKGLKEETANLEIELLRAKGDTARANAAQRALDTQGFTEAEIAVYDYNQSIRDQIKVLTEASNLEREISDNRRDYADRILQQEAELLAAQGRTVEADKKRREILDRQRARENERLMALNPELARLAYELWLLEDATAAATRAAKERKEISDDLYNALVKAVDAEKTLLNEQKARLEETVSTLKAVFDILKSSVEDLYGEVSSTAAMQASEGRGVIAQAIATGILPDSKLLDTSIQAVRDEISNSLYVSKADADKARLIFAAQLALLKGTTEEQLTDAEKQLKAVNAQISYLDNILKTAKEQLDAFLGNTEVLKSVDKALADLYAFLQNPSAAKPVPKPVGTEKPSTSTGTGGGAVFGPGGGGGGSSQSYSYYRPVGLGTSIGYQPVTDEATISRLDKLSSLYHSFDGTGDLAGLLNSIKAAGGTMYDLEALSGHFYNDWVKAGMSVGIPAFAEGGNYRGGVALVGEEGPELINFSNPGQVYTARQTASMLSGESSEVVAELKAVRSEIIMLRAEVRADVSHNAKTAKLLDRVIPEGDSVQVTIS